MHSVFQAHNSSFSAKPYKQAYCFGFFTTAIGCTLPVFTSINYSIISACRAIKSYSAFSATRTISLFTFFALHRLQIPSGKWRQHFTTLAKPYRRVAIPFCNTCKAPSASGDTILQQLQSPVSTWPYPFATPAKHLRHVAKPLYNCCNAFQSIISHSQYSKLRPHFSKQQFS